VRYSEVFPKTKREAPKEAVTANHKLLVRGGFIDQLMAGSWTLLPLGWRVITKINQIIREEMNAIGGQEMLMPLMHPKEIWNETKRWESAAEVMYQLKDSREKEFALSFTHEEIVMDLTRKHTFSYKDLPFYIYHFSTKFRNEARPQGGILRGREFMMKDLYSLHTSEEDLMRFYEVCKDAYTKIFHRIGLKTYITEASGGVFTEKHTHEFQVEAEAGEDTVYVCDKCLYGTNKEIYEEGGCPKCGKELREARSIEVGNIFPLGIKKYAQMMGVEFTDKDGSRKPVWFGSYGIGPTRVMGTIVEASHDEKGIIWPEAVAPYRVHLVDLTRQAPLRQGFGGAKAIYDRLLKADIDVLWDDTDRGAGEKFADADLLGIPIRLVTSEKTGEKVEWKGRTDGNTELLAVEEVIKRLKN
jgi:prolyl-tRNA synthetase